VSLHDIFSLKEAWQGALILRRLCDYTEFLDPMLTAVAKVRKAVLLYNWSQKVS